MASVLITGTSKGIGLEAALAFGRAGHQVYATMRNPSQSPALAETAAREKLPITISTMDVDSDESVSNAIAAIQKNGPIDVLVNNAGVEGVGPVEEFPLAKFRAIMETNYFGALRCIQAVLPQMRQRRSGCIINISSVAGRICNPPLTSYCASKWALEALSEGSRVNSRHSMFASPSSSRASSIPQWRSALETRRPDRRMARPPASLLSSRNHWSTPVPPSLVAEKILEVAQSDSWQLRHPVGPDAAGFLEWRRKMSDEEWVEMNAGDDESFFAKLGEAN